MKIATTNLWQGGGLKRYLALCEHIDRTDSDIHVLTEFRPNTKVTGFLVKKLEEFGYHVTYLSSWDGQNSVAIASKDRVKPSGLCGLSTQYCLSIEKVGCTFVGLYAPQPKIDKLFHSRVAECLSSILEPTIILGDWNAGLHHVDEAGKVFTRHKEMLKLYETGWSECWRMFNDAKSVEYSWYHPRTRNGFRIDQAFVNPALANRVIASYYDHNERLKGNTDHSTLVVELGPLSD